VGQIPLRQGRVFTEADREGTPLVVEINEAMARRYWPGESPIGKRVRMGFPGRPYMARCCGS
jgi:putative ABC transport system permease protein